MFEPFDIKGSKTCWPLFVHQRLALTQIDNTFLFAIETGYWYWLRSIRAKWPEIDAAGAVFAPEIMVRINESAIHRVHQNAAFPFRLITSPASNGVQVNAGGQMTATGVTSVKMLDEVRPARDNLTVVISGQNATPFPAFIEIVLFGYMIPDATFRQWKGSNNG